MPRPTTDLREAPSSAYPGLDRSPKKNWVDKVGGLPSYIERVAKHLHYEKGNPISQAIATAVNWVTKGCATGTTFGGKVKVSKATQAKMCAAKAEWEAKKGKSKAKSISEAVELLEAGGSDLELSAEDAEELRTIFEARLQRVEMVNTALRAPGATTGGVEAAKALLEAEDCEPVRLAIGGPFAEPRVATALRREIGHERAQLRALVEGLGGELQEAKKDSDEEMKDRVEKVKGRGPRDRRPTEPHSGSTTLKKGASGKMVEHAQTRLKELGYEVGVDGDFGDETDNATRSFQGDHKLKVDGEIGRETKTAMRGTTAKDVTDRRTESASKKLDDPAVEGDKKLDGKAEPGKPYDWRTKGRGVDGEPDPQVKKDQEALIGMGTFVGDTGADGRFGPETEKGVRRVQKRYGLKVDGLIGPATGGLLERGGPDETNGAGKDGKDPGRNKPGEKGSAKKPAKSQKKPQKDKDVEEAGPGHRYSTHDSPIVSKARQQTRPKGRGGQPVKDPDFERKHPRAAKGRVGGGSFKDKPGDGTSSPQMGANGKPQTFATGANGNQVKKIQRLLNLDPSGNFDKATKQAVRSYQEKHDLLVDGIVGAQTLASLLGKEAREPGTIPPELLAALGNYSPEASKPNPTPKPKPSPKSSPIAAPAEDSLSRAHTDKLASEGWDYHDGHWWPPGHSKNLREAAPDTKADHPKVEGILVEAAIAQVLVEDKLPDAAATLLQEASAFGRLGSSIRSGAEFLTRSGTSVRKLPGGKWQARDRHGRWKDMPGVPDLKGLTPASADDRIQRALADLHGERGMASPGGKMTSAQSRRFAATRRQDSTAKAHVNKDGVMVVSWKNKAKPGHVNIDYVKPDGGLIPNREYKPGERDYGGMASPGLSQSAAEGQFRKEEIAPGKWRYFDGDGKVFIESSKVPYTHTSHHRLGPDTSTPGEIVPGLHKSEAAARKSKMRGGSQNIAVREIDTGGQASPGTSVAHEFEDDWDVGETRTFPGAGNVTATEDGWELRYEDGSSKTYNLEEKPALVEAIDRWSGKEQRGRTQGQVEADKKAHNARLHRGMASPALSPEAEKLERERERYTREHYGPQWGEKDEKEVARIDRELVRAYDAAGTPQEDRLAHLAGQASPSTSSDSPDYLKEVIDKLEKDAPKMDQGEREKAVEDVAHDLYDAGVEPGDPRLKRLDKIAPELIAPSSNEYARQWAESNERSPGMYSPGSKQPKPEPLDEPKKIRIHVARKPGGAYGGNPSEMSLFLKEPWGEKTQVEITHRLTLNGREWNGVVREGVLADRDYFKALRGKGWAEVVNGDTGQTFFVDTQGASYPRYVGVPGQDTSSASDGMASPGLEINEKASAAKAGEVVLTKGGGRFFVHRQQDDGTVLVQAAGQPGAPVRRFGAEEPVRRIKAQPGDHPDGPPAPTPPPAASRTRRPGPKGQRRYPKKEAEAAGGTWATAKGLEPGDEVFHHGDPSTWKTVKRIEDGRGGVKVIHFEDGTSSAGGNATKMGVKKKSSKQVEGGRTRAESNLDSLRDGEASPGFKDAPASGRPYTSEFYETEDEKGLIVVDKDGRRIEAFEIQDSDSDMAKLINELNGRDEHDNGWDGDGPIENENSFRKSQGLDPVKPKDGMASPATKGKKVKTLDFEAMKQNREPEWQGFGYIGTREQLTPAERKRADEAISAVAAEEGWTEEQIFDFANSRAGRHLADAFTIPQQAGTTKEDAKALVRRYVKYHLKDGNSIWSLPGRSKGLFMAQGLEFLEVGDPYSSPGGTGVVRTDHGFLVEAADQPMLYTGDDAAVKVFEALAAVDLEEAEAEMEEAKEVEETEGKTEEEPEAEAEEPGLQEAADLLGADDWDPKSVQEALDQLGEQGISLDPEVEKPETLAAVIRAANIQPDE